MDEVQVVTTSLGAVEILYLPGVKPPVLFFPGGHCRAGSDCGWSLYTSLGYGVLAFSRPGYGRTDVGPLTAAEFLPAVAESARRLDIEKATAAVGVSFGGLQAIATAVSLPHLPPRLVLHSCAPSTHPYPDSPLQARIAPVVFGPALSGHTWKAVARSVATDPGLRRMAGTLSDLPTGAWWDTFPAGDRQRARELFQSMASGSGFANDLRQARRARSSYRRRTQARVGCPTLVTASRHDGGVAYAHAEDFRDTIPTARLVELPAPSHLFWLGPSRGEAAAAVRDFLAPS
ncbi:alpha/beta hydrolase [Arthrobacter sp. MSA 4-2]|uniref:alpha/beta fold hydrolase n=1 Tax=Arthrobacter sp. MSA 4-2 TaxID=2794349 RepID=UPI0018E7CAAE|nr:alpha/beta hydrolase [Arthrobacter sp. MSA 4-2]MBJ2119897.1 alpha/beta hydrolase [Arthrobacter sp. MSA 4-2]